MKTALLCVNISGVNWSYQLENKIVKEDNCIVDKTRNSVLLYRAAKLTL